MTAHHKHRPKPPRLHRRLSTGLETVDTQWKAYHRYVFGICAEHLSPSDELVQFALSVATAEELSGLAAHILERKEDLGLRADAVSDVTSVAAAAPAAPALQTAPAPSLRRLQQVCFRVVRHNETLHPTVVDYIVDTAEIPLSTPPLPDIVAEIATLFGLSPVHAGILIALFALEDIEPIGNMMRQATHRTQMKILADIAEIDLTVFVRETAPGSPLERLGLIAYRGGRDEIADMNVSRPLLFALRSNTLDDLRAGLFDQTPSPQFDLDEFSVPRDEMRTCAAAVRGCHPLLIAGEPGIGKTEFVRTLVTALGRRAHTLAATNRHSEEIRPHRGGDGENGRLNAIRMAVNILSPATDVLIIDEADALLQSAAGFFGLFGGIGGGGGSYDKALLNDLLEHLPVPTVWITNDHRLIPTSALRRFGHVYAFPHPSVDTRVRMLSERLAPILGSGDADAVPALPGSDTAVVPRPGTVTGPDTDTARWTRDLAARYDITPAAIDRTARIITAELDAEQLSPTDVRTRVAAYIDQISTGALAHDVRRLPGAARRSTPCGSPNGWAGMSFSSAPRTFSQNTWETRRSRSPRRSAPPSGPGRYSSSTRRTPSSTIDPSPSAPGNTHRSPSSSSRSRSSPASSSPAPTAWMP